MTTSNESSWKFSPRNEELVAPLRCAQLWLFLVRFTYRHCCVSIIIRPSGCFISPHLPLRAIWVWDLCTKSSDLKSLQSLRVANSLKTWKKTVKGCFDIEARGPQKREAQGICPVYPMVNPALRVRYQSRRLTGIQHKRLIRTGLHINNDDQS